MVEDPYQVRNFAQNQSASDARLPDHSFTSGRANNNVSFAQPSAPPARANPYGGDEDDEPAYPAPPSFPPPATPPAANPFGDSGDSQTGRKQSYAFTDEEGDGGDEDVEEV